MKMKDKWFERGGFLYDITKEYGRLRKKDIKDIIDNPNNNKSDLDYYEIRFLNNLDNVAKNFITRRIPKNVDSVSIFHTCFKWSQNNNEKKLPIIDELKSFANTNFIYKLHKLPDEPDDWENRSFRYYWLWAEIFTSYWPDKEQLRYSIDVISKNYPAYNDWEPTIEIESSNQKWQLSKKKDEKTVLTTDIATSFWGPFRNLAKIEETKKQYFNKDGTNIEDFIQKVNCPEFKAFSKVVYTIGNIIPAAANYKPGSKEDNSYNKLLEIRKAFYLPKAERTEIINNVEPKLSEDKKKIKNKRLIKNYEAAILFLHWLEYYNKEDTTTEQIWNKFIKDHYLQDFVERENDNYTDPIKTDNPADLAKRIIQRGYRIYYQYERDNEGKIKYKDDNPVRNKDLFNDDLSFTCKAKKELQIAFKAVGIPDDNLNLI